MAHVHIKLEGLTIEGNQNGITKFEPGKLSVEVMDTKPVTPKLTPSQLKALRLCWLADRNIYHPALTITHAFGKSSYSDPDGHVRTGCDLTRYPTMKKLRDLGLVELVDNYTVHITDAGRFAADVYGFTE
jgi:hypothetical protein